MVFDNDPSGAADRVPGGPAPSAPPGVEPVFEELCAVLAGTEHAGVADALTCYLNAIGSVPLLTAEQEVEFGRQIEAGLLARAELETPPGPDPRRRGQLRAVVEEGQHARQRMVLGNLRLVVAVARRWSVGDVPLLDLIQEGNLGLLHAVEKWDFARGNKFSTYAIWWIRQAVEQGASEMSGTVRTPTWAARAARRVRRAEEEIAATQGHAATTEQVAALLEVTPQRVRDIRSWARRPRSLEAPAHDEAQLGDLLVDEQEAGPEEQVLARLERSEVAQLLQLLPHRARAVLALRFGLTDGQVRSLAQVGSELHLSRGRIYQLEREALATLRGHLQPPPGGALSAG